MSRSSRAKGKLSEIQQLCCLGLASETAMPQLMPLMRDWLHADIGHFLWVDSDWTPVNYCGDMPPDDAVVQTFFGNHQAMSMPGFRSYGDFVRNARSTAFGGKDDSVWHETALYQEVLRHLSGECILGLVVREGPARTYGSFTFHRSQKNRPFTDEERRHGEQIASYLALLFNDSQGARPSDDHDHCIEQGVALFSTGGRMEHQDEAARRLILWAQHEHPEAGRRRPHGIGSAVAQRLGQLCANLEAVFAGRPAPRPVFQVNNAWGRFVFRGQWLNALDAGGRARICVTISHYVPTRLAVWRRIAALGLPPRLQQICLQFADGQSLTEIAEKTGLSRYTVIDHVNRLYERFGIQPSRAELMSFLLDQDGVPGGTLFH